MTIDNADLRQFILQFFNDEELDTLCFDYFPEVQQNFTGAMTKNRKALLLIGYCETRGRLADLHGALARERETAWNRVSGAAPPVETGRRLVSTPTARDPRQVFLSHATADVAFAHRLAGDLRAEGWSVWIAPESIRPGEKWVEAIDRGLETSGVFVVALTPAAVGSRWVRTETNAALTLEHRDLLSFLPLDVDQCDVPLLWSGYQFTSFRRSYEAGLADLLGLLDGTPVPAAPVETGRRPVSTSDAKPTPRERYVKEEQWRQLQVLAHEIAAALGRQSGDDELREVYRRFNRQFDLRTYKKLPRRRFPEGLAFLTAWRDEVMAAAPVETGRRPVSTMSPNRRTHEKTNIELIRIPAGPFLYGSADSDEMARSDEKPQRTVDLPEYWIGRTPVTNDQFARFVRATGHKTAAERKGYGRGWTGSKWEDIKGASWLHPRGPESSSAGRGNHPVVQVSWEDAKAFCDWAGLALPTEAQWEKAARGTDGRIWPWGNEPPTADRCNFNMNVGDTTPVGQYSPKGDSPYGCWDMAGNVWEWLGSWYKEGSTRALRGGSWFLNDQSTRAAYRLNNYPDDWYGLVGFRVVELLSDSGF